MRNDANKRGQNASAGGSTASSCILMVAPVPVRPWISIEFYSRLIVVPQVFFPKVVKGADALLGVGAGVL